MTDRRIFSTMSPEAAKFYHRVFNSVLLNMYAVQDGLFDTLLCETDDDAVLQRWYYHSPAIAEVITSRRRPRQNLGE